MIKIKADLFAKYIMFAMISKQLKENYPNEVETIEACVSKCNNELDKELRAGMIENNLCSFALEREDYETCGKILEMKEQIKELL